VFAPMPKTSTKTAAMAKPGAFISCRQANRKSWIMISNEMRAESRTDSTIFAAPGRLRNQMDVPAPISNMARVIPNRTDGEGPRESLMITNATLCDLDPS